MIELVGQKVLAAALIVGLSLGFGFLPAVLAKKYLQHSQKRICRTHKKVLAAHKKTLHALAKFWDIAIVNSSTKQPFIYVPLIRKVFGRDRNIFSGMISPVWILQIQR